MRQPEPRYGTREAIDHLSKELNIQFVEGMQDWPYEVANADDIDQYIAYYRLTADDNNKFLLMQAIIQAVEEQRDLANFKRYWATIEPLLTDDFKIHEYTIFYWSCFERENLNDCWTVTANMRQLWNNMAPPF